MFDNRLKSKLGELLQSGGKLSAVDLKRALQAQLEQGGGERLGNILVNLGVVSEQDMVTTLAQQLGVELIDASRFPLEPLNDERISAKFLRESRVVLIEQEPDRLQLAMADPQNAFVIHSLRLLTGAEIETLIALPSEIERFYSQHQEQETTATLDDQAAEHLSDDIEQLREQASEAPVIKLLNQVLRQAVERGASDIHVEPFRHEVQIRYRVDGVLQSGDRPKLEYGAALVSRVKIMANLNIAERRLPQDGRFHIRLQGRELDLRVSTVPSMHGEGLVMRLLDRADVKLELRALGFSDELRAGLQQLLQRPHGILLVTGPTGSGKTTTLYTALELLNTVERKILTVEDPVEYQLDGINQIQVNSAIGLTFAHTLRSLLRQDPDVMMIGEMRDTETAKIAVQSALTGHLVLSTLHTNDAVSSVMRLQDMGVEGYLVASTLNGVLAQRLVRRLCTHCREPYRPGPELIQRWALDRRSGRAEPPLYRAKGCEACNHSGYVGRICIGELLVMNDEIRRAVLDGHEDRVLTLARSHGMVTLFEDGLNKALQGDTSLEEVLRITMDS